MCSDNNTSNYQWLVDRFDPISLEGLNQKAEMLSRVDNKYVVGTSDLAKVLEQLSDDFEILEIGSRRGFTYHTRYFDDSRRSAYYEHHQGLRKGFKVRVRRYSDAGLAYLEVKVKGKRGETVKHRFGYHPELPEDLTEADIRTIEEVYFNHYGKLFWYDLKRSLDLEYKRFTLVAKQGEERMTIDTGLSFSHRGKKASVSPDVFIVETKSRLGRGLADIKFRSLHQRPTKRCSKYCIGIATLGEVTRWNRFIPTMRKMDLIRDFGAGPRLLPPPVQTPELQAV